LIRRSRKDDVLARMRAANPVSAAQLRGAIGEAELARAMRGAIALGESPVERIPSGRAGGGVLARHRGLSLGLGLAGAFAVAAVLLLTGGSVDSVRDGGHPAYAAAAVEVAEANPRLLVTAPGWRIIHARGFEVDSGELIYKHGDDPAFGPGAHQLQLDWYPARRYADYRREAAAGAPRDRVTSVTSTLLGQRATTFHYAGYRPSSATILAPQGNVFVIVHGTLGREENGEVLRSLRPVGVDAWLAAMPPEVVQPATRSAAIGRMLGELPVPPRFDVSALRSGTILSDRYMLGKAVAGAVACDWLWSWQSANRAGDDAAARKAVEALGSARHWPVLLRMVRERGYRADVLPANGQGWPSQIVAAGEEIAAGHLRREPAVKVIQVKGEPVGYVTSADTAPFSVLGCDRESPSRAP